jgi:hypothetical protein
MRPREHLWLQILGALALGAALLAGCAADPPAQAEPGAAVDVLPTPPPMPTSPPQLPTPTPPPAPAMGNAPASGALLLHDDFDRAGLAGWTIVDAADTGTTPSIWQVASGRLGPVSDGDGMPGLYATAQVTGDPAWRDYTVSAAAYATGNDEMGVVARASDAGYYVFRLLPDGSQASRFLARYDAATSSFKTIASADGVGFVPGRWYRLNLRVQGDHLQGFVDGQRVLDARDTTLTQGRAGVYGYAEGGLVFDDFAVQSLPAARK